MLLVGLVQEEIKEYLLQVKDAFRLQTEILKEEWVVLTLKYTLFPLLLWLHLVSRVNLLIQEHTSNLLTHRKGEI